MRPFPNAEDGQWLISRGGGTRPLWARDGRELFYVAGDGQLIVVRVQTESFAAGNPDVVFEGRYYAPVAGAPGRTYDISLDGERFLMIKESGKTSATGFVLVLNWFEELKTRVPTEK